MNSLQLRETFRYSYTCIYIFFSIYSSVIKTNSAIRLESFLVLLWLATGRLAWKTPHECLERQFISTEKDLIFANQVTHSGRLAGYMFTKSDFFILGLQVDWPPLLLGMTVEVTHATSRPGP